MNETPAQLRQLLSRLISDWENEVIEFKLAENGKFTEVVGKYVSALSNEANLRRAGFAWLVYGVDNKTRKVVGTTTQAGQGLKREIAQCSTSQHTIREIYEVQAANGKRALLFQIPAAPRGIPIAWKGHWYGRNGESLCPLELSKLEDIRKQHVDEDWSAGVIPDAGIEDLDPDAIAKAREQFAIRNPKYAKECMTWDVMTFLNKAKLTIKGKITRTTLLLLGREEAEHFLNPAVAKIRWNLRTLENQDKDFEVFSIPFMLATEEVQKKIRNLKYRYILDNQSLFPEEILRYEPFCIRELLHNCIAHQDYTRQGRINVVEFEDDHLVFSNCGTFIPQSVEAVVLSDAPEETYRNTFLVEAMRNLNMIDTQGGGIKKIFNFQRERYFPMPDYDFANEKVKATLTGRIINNTFARLLKANPKLTLSDIIILDKVQKKQPVDSSDAERLKRQGMLEGRKPVYFLSARAAEEMEDDEIKAQYIKNASFDNAYYQDLIITYLKKFKKANKSAFIALLQDKLSDSLSYDQKIRKISNLLADLRQNKKIVCLNRKSWVLPK